MIDTTDKSIEKLSVKAEKIRKKILQIIFKAKGGHTGGSLSSVDILTALYFDQMNVVPGQSHSHQRDRFILSKGHSVEGLYCVLAEAGFISEQELDTYGQFNSLLAGHPTVKVHGIELNSGALGHGLSVGVGMAIAAKMDGLKNHIYVLMGDGEQAEGSIYEAAMSAAHHKLNKIIAIIDRNKLQISGETEHVMSIDPLCKRWESLGWEVYECDGHDFHELKETFVKAKSSLSQKPQMIIAHTTKGKGVSFIENQAKWHHKVPNSEELSKAIEEIDLRIFKLQSTK